MGVRHAKESVYRCGKTEEESTKGVGVRVILMVGLS